MKRAVIYARVSTQQQVANFSLETQERECRVFCSRSGWQIVEVFVDRGESAKTINRPEFQRMLTVCQQARNRIDVVVVYALTRFSRENHDHQVVRALLSRHSVTLRSVMEPIDDTASGRLMENIGAVLAHYDNQAKSERTHAGMRSKLISGQWPWKAPIGYKQQGSRSASTFVPDHGDPSRTRSRTRRRAPSSAGRRNAWMRAFLAGSSLVTTTKAEAAVRSESTSLSLSAGRSYGRGLPEREKS